MKQLLFKILDISVWILIVAIFFYWLNTNLDFQTTLQELCQN